MVESVRHEKWLKSQENKTVFMESFNNFKHFDNSKSIEFIEEEITDTYIKITNFIDSKNYSDAAISWLDRSGKLNVNEKFNTLFGLVRDNLMIFTWFFCDEKFLLVLPYKYLGAAFCMVTIDGG